MRRAPAGIAQRAGARRLHLRRPEPARQIRDRKGTFELSSQADLENPKATSETTDAYDTIEWLVKNVPNNNGKVGMFGVSYDGLTSAMTCCGRIRRWPRSRSRRRRRSVDERPTTIATARCARATRSNMPVYEQADRTRIRTSTSRPTTRIRGISRSARCRTSTRSTCTDRFRTGTPSSSILITTPSGRPKRG
jgi:hypothetical protein